MANVDFYLLILDRQKNRLHCGDSIKYYKCIQVEHIFFLCNVVYGISVIKLACFRLHLHYMKKMPHTRKKLPMPTQLTHLPG